MLPSSLASSRAALRADLRAYLSALIERSSNAHRDLIRPELLTKPIVVKLRQGYVDRQVTPRFTIFLRGSGCSWMDRTGGCTFCGFWASHNLGSRVDATAMFEQVRAAIAAQPEDFASAPIVCLYNGGSMLDEAEIELEGTARIFELLASHRNVREIVVEAKVTDLAPRRIEALLARLGDVKLTISIGFESANEVVRDICVNKGFSTRLFEDRMQSLARLGVATIPLLIVKPPFLGEREAIEDTLASLRYLEAFRPQRIDLELPVVKKFTMMHELWQRGEYKPPRLWAVLEILRRHAAEGHTTPVFWSPPNIPGDGDDFSQNCPGCNDVIVSRAYRYNERFDVRVFDDVACACREEWLAELAKEPAPELDPAVLLPRLDRTLRSFFARVST